LSSRVLEKRSSSSDANETINAAVQAPTDAAVYERVLQQFLKALAKDEEQLLSAHTTTDQVYKCIISIYCDVFESYDLVGRSHLQPGSQ
jgi:hypothetical protein